MYIDLNDLKAHLNITGDDDDVLLQAKLDAAEQAITSLIVPLDTTQPVPDPIKEATRKLAAALYECREAIDATRYLEAEFGVCFLLLPYRDFAF